jgi:CRP/FNR family transcriptional regulator
MRIDESRREYAYKKGEVICREGEEIERFLYLQRGLVKLLKTEKNDKEHIISIAKPLDFIGLLSIFSNKKHIYTITAIEDSVVCEVRLDIIKQLMKENGDFALDFIEKISKVADDVINTRLNINTKQLRGRIAYILLFFTEHIYGKNSYELPISRKEIAQLIDMSTENVIRILSEFRKDDIITIEGKNITIHDLERLKRIYELG